MERAWLGESNTSRCALDSTTHLVWAWTLPSASPAMKSGGIAGTGLRCWPRIQRDAGEQYKKDRGKFWKRDVKLAGKKKNEYRPQHAFASKRGAPMRSWRGVGLPRRPDILTLTTVHFQPPVLISCVKSGSPRIPFSKKSSSCLWF